MQALEIYPTFGIENLRLQSRDEPSLNPGEVKVRVQAVSLNFRDLATVKGVNYPDIQLPRIPCSDGAGEIVEIGAGVGDWKVGDSAMALFMPNWMDGSLTPEKAASSQGGLEDGMAAEYRVLPAESLVRIPEHLSIEEASTLPCAALTAWNALFENRPLKASDTVLVRGTGGVATFAFQLAKALGCRVLATSGSLAKRQRLQELGADAVCDYKNENWVEWALAQTEGKGVDVIVDSVGGEGLNESLEAIRLGGYVALMGVLDGVEGKIRTANILRKNVHLQGIYVGSKEMMLRMNAFLSEHQIKPLISEQYPWEEAQSAFRCMEEGRHFGKILLNLK